MPRQTGYRVVITGFLKTDKSLTSQKEALDALTGPLSDMVAKLVDTDVQPKMTSRQVNDAGEPVPRAPRKPRTVKGAGRKAA